jgi:surfeit locus 1 family protein
MQIFNYRFRPRLIPTIATLLTLPILVNLGLWQSRKAEQKQILQLIYEKRGTSEPVKIGADPLVVEEIRYSRVVVSGQYEPSYQILLDNQIYKGQAGYHVITPLHINGNNMRILVNRGWIPMGKDRSTLPVIDTPSGEIELTGFAHDQSGKYIELTHPDAATTSWQKVWQNLDLKLYKAAVPFPIQSVTILLDPASPAGGYVREWPKPDARIEVNRGYAVQWYLMSLTLVVIYLVTNLKKIFTEDQTHVK